MLLSKLSHQLSPGEKRLQHDFAPKYANPVYVKEQARHYIAVFTLDVYGHLIPSQKRAHNLPTNASTFGDSARPLAPTQELAQPRENA